MDDLIATAKCGILDGLFIGSFWFPLMPTVLVVTAFVLAHTIGMALAHVTGNRRIGFHALRRGLPYAGATVVLIVCGLLAWSGVAYPFFLMRMAKDAYFCSYFEVSRDVQTVQLTAFGLVFLVQLFSVAGYTGHRLRALEFRAVRIAWISGYVALCVIAYSAVLMLPAQLI